MKFKSIQFFSYLICLLPLALISGPLIPEFIILSCNIFFLIKVFKEKKFIYFNNFFFKGFLLFWFFINISTIFSEYFFYSLKYSLGYLRYGLFVLAISYLINNNDLLIKTFYKSLLITISILLIDSYIQYLFDFNLFGFERPNKYMISSFFGEELILGTYLMRLSPLLIAMYLCVGIKEKKNFNAYLFYIALIFPMIFLSGQRTPFYLSIIFLISLFFIFKINRKLIFSLIISLLIIFSNIVVDNKKYEGVGTGYKNRMIFDIIYNYNKIPEYQENKIDKNFLKFIFISPSHNNLWLTSLELFNKKKLTGHGPNTFRKKCKDVDAKKIYGESLIKNNSIVYCSTHPHNYFFQLLAETGIIAVLIYLLIYFVTIKMIIVSYIHLNKNDLKYDLIVNILLLFTIVINFFPLVPSGNFFNNHQNILIFLPIGFLINFMQFSKKFKQ